VNTQYLGLVEYVPTLSAMQAFTSTRTSDTPDALWLCEHPPTFTQGLAGKAEHVLIAGDIPVVQTNRGGQVTYHGPGQVVAYPLINLKRAGYFVKEYVFKLEESVIRTLAHFGITGHRVGTAPGIYVRLDEPKSHAQLDIVATDRSPESVFNRERLGKIAALGIKVSRHYTYHGVALNVAMNLEPFSRINPCGYVGLTTVDLMSLEVFAAPAEVAIIFSKQLTARLS
jgi:lipoyl(octanoyl) transferase